VSALSKRAAEVEKEFGAAWSRYHVGAQAARFLAGVVTALLLSLHSGFSDWTNLLPLVAGAAWTTAAQMWPQVPWKLVRDHFGAGKPPPATGGYIPGPGAAP
jgi:hypothetical protein